jgi:hypothetical protein
MSSYWLPSLGAIMLFSLLNSPGAQMVATPSMSARTETTTLDTAPHLVGWWKFDDASGKTAVDSSTPGHPGTLEGGLSFATNSASGRIGAALRMGGKGDCVRIKGFKGVTGTQPRTIVAWIKTATAAGEIVSWGQDAAGKMWTFGFIRGHVGVTPKGGYLYMKALTQDDAWHQVAVVVQPASPPNLHDHVKLFQDGTLAEIDDIGLLDLLPIETGNQLDVRIGGRFQGLIDDVRIYDRALSEEEIKALYRGLTKGNKR